MQRRARLLIRAANTRPAGASLRDQFQFPGGPWLTRAEVEAALSLEPGSERSDRLLGACFSSLEGGAAVVAREAFLAFLELGAPLSSSPPPLSAQPAALVLVPTRTYTAAATTKPATSNDASHPRRVLLLPDSTNEEHLLRRRPHWWKREVVVEERVVEYTTVNEEGAAQSLVDRERTVTEVLHWEAPLTGEAAHRERIAYQQREAFDGVQTSASAGEEQYVHLHNTEHQEFESMRSNLPERYYAGREPPPHPHRRQPSFEEGKGKGGADWQSVAFAGERR